MQKRQETLQTKLKVQYTFRNPYRPAVLAVGLKILWKFVLIKIVLSQKRFESKNGYITCIGSGSHASWNWTSFISRNVQIFYEMMELSFYNIISCIHVENIQVHNLICFSIVVDCLSSSIQAGNIFILRFFADNARKTLEDVSVLVQKLVYTIHILYITAKYFVRILTLHC